MIKVSFYYLSREGARFDIDYTCNSPMPFAIEKPGACLKSY
jgi:hypothetical protein